MHRSGIGASELDFFQRHMLRHTFWAAPARRRPYARFLIWQGRQESNPQPTVLETVALPIELRPYVFPQPLDPR